MLGRGHRFRSAEKVLKALALDLKTRNLDAAIFSGDATALGFKEEMELAIRILDLDSLKGLPGLAVPGNHDYCTHSSMASGDFEALFSRWQVGKRVDEKPYPFARKIGDIWLIGVNSAMANSSPWNATGKVGSAQLDRLKDLLDILDDGPRILVTHYPVCLANGRPERSVRALKDLDQLLTVARQGKISLWLHGHRHNHYIISPDSVVPFPVICAGSATQEKLWSYGEYTISQGTIQINQRIYQPAQNRFIDQDPVTIPIPDHFNKNS